ncbi:hypothetical protein PINS_up000506 [Pythium insidiosum]|nr:hypothetical protein PINS_up000506 [Pythium insidiosum]
MEMAVLPPAESASMRLHAEEDDVDHALHPEEALLDAYELQWKALDIRLEQVRNECERMILEFEVEMKHQLYLRECEAVLQQQTERHSAEREQLQHAIEEKDDLLRAAREHQRRMEDDEAERLRAIEEERRSLAAELQQSRADEQQLRKEREEELARRKQEQEQAERLRKANEKEAERRRLEEERQKQEDEKAEMRRRKEAEKEESKRKKQEEKEELQRKKQEEKEELQRKRQEEKDEQQRKKQEEKEAKRRQKEESKTLQKSSQKRLQKGKTDQQQDEQPEDQAKTSTKKPSAKRPHPKKKAEPSPKPVLSRSSSFEVNASSAEPVNSETPSDVQPSTVSGPVDDDELLKNASGIADDELLQMLSQDQGYESEDFGAEPAIPSLILPESPAAKGSLGSFSTIGKASKFKPSLTIVTEPNPEPSSDSDAGAPVQITPRRRALKRRKTAVSPAPSPAARERGSQELSNAEVAKSQTEAPPTSTSATVKQTQTQAQPKAATSATEPTLTNEGARIHEEDQPSSTSTQPNRAKTGADQTSSKDRTNKTKKLKSNQKTKLTAKEAAAKAAEAEISQLTGISAAHDIATPKVPRKKARQDGKKKQMNLLAAKRAEFQKILGESSKDGETEQPSDSGDQEEATQVGSKRQRGDEPEVARAIDFVTPVKKVKKVKKTKSVAWAQDKRRFANDELNIMKSPVPLVPIQRSGVSISKKRTIADRGETDSSEPAYGSPAVNYPTPSHNLVPPSAPSSTLTKEKLAAAGSDYASRWLNSSLVTRAKKRTVVAARKKTAAVAGAPKPTTSLWGNGPSFFDAFVNNTAPSIPRLKSSGSAS